jgi:hypothetical protein
MQRLIGRGLIPTPDNLQAAAASLAGLRGEVDALSVIARAAAAVPVHVRVSTSNRPDIPMEAAPFASADARGATPSSSHTTQTTAGDAGVCRSDPRVVLSRIDLLDLCEELMTDILSVQQVLSRNWFVTPAHRTEDCWNWITHGFCVWGDACDHKHGPQN